MKLRKVGIIINPFAGLGGTVALKGSDGEETIQKALTLGAVPRAEARCRIALKELLSRESRLVFSTYGGKMGESLLRELALPYHLVGFPEKNGNSTAEDSQKAARLLLEEGVDLLLFAGGDGTARDIYHAVGEKLPVLGIPSGVKMHSAVYAINPLSAGRAAADYLSGKNPALKLAEVMDIDEEKFRHSILSARLFGYLKTVDDSAYVQCCKSGSSGPSADLRSLAAGIAEDMRDDALYLIGPGSTTRTLLEELQLPFTLLGVDLVRNHRLVQRDATEEQIWELLKSEEQEAYLILTIIGGQGNLLGRGNQQFSPRVLRRIGRSNLIVMASLDKLLNLGGRPLGIDTGDPELDEAWSGPLPVHTAYRAKTIYRLGNESSQRTCVP